MKKTLMLASLIALPVGLTGCDKQADAPKADLPKAEANADAMASMAMPTETKMGSGTGTVTAIDAAAGKITLDHGAIPAVGGHAMTMGFSAPELLTGVAVGGKVDFDVIVSGNAGEVTRIKKQ